MSLRKQTFKGTLTLGVGQALSQGLAFVRNLIVARLLTPADMGVAASLALTLSLLEMLSDVAADKLIVQAVDGDDPRLQGVAQLVQFVRGIVQAAVLLALSWPVAALFNMPDARWAFQMVSLVPLIRGMAHLDPNRFFRELRYGPSVLSELIPQTVSVLAAWPLAHAIGNYGAVLWLVLGQSVVFVICTHVTATRPYRWAVDRGLMGRIAGFGWPLVLNAILLFGINQGDKAIVGAAYTRDELGVYSVAFLLAAAPVMVLGKLSIAVGLPLLARVQEDQGLFASRYRLLMQTTGLVAACIAVPLILAGPMLIRALYGADYAGAGAYFGWLAAMGAVRMLRMPPTVAAMARGDNVNALIGNVVRSVSLLGILAAAAVHAEIVWIPILSLGGECLALVVAIVRLGMKQGIAFFDSVAVAVAVCLMMVGAGGTAWVTIKGSVLSVTMVSAIGEAATLVLLTVAFASVRKEVAMGAAWLRSRWEARLAGM